MSTIFDLDDIKTYIETMIPALAHPIYIENIPDSIDECYALRYISKQDKNGLVSTLHFEIIFRGKPSRTKKECYDNFMLVSDMFRQRGTHSLNGINICVINVIGETTDLMDGKKRIYIINQYSLLYKDRKPTY